MGGDSADVAFRHYLTGLETLAKIRIISGYHDGKTLDDGYTYFIGIAPNSPQDYYWRRLDQSEQSQKRKTRSPIPILHIHGLAGKNYSTYRQSIS